MPDNDSYLDSPNLGYTRHRLSKLVYAQTIRIFPLSLTPPPADRYIPDTFKQQQSSGTAIPSQSQGAGITLSSQSINGSPIPDVGFAHGNGISDDFKLWLSRHPGMTIDEALHLYREEQKQRSRVRLKH